MCLARGVELSRSGKMADAVVLYRSALLVQPDLGEAHLNLALAYRDLGRRDFALRHARRGEELLPADRRALRLVRELTPKR